MLSTILCSTLILQSPAKMTSPQVVSVSMFKNGFAFVTRKIAISGSEANIVEVPRASLGTLWFWTPEGEIQNISTAEEISKKKTEINLQNFDQLVSKNVGKTVYVESNTSAPIEGKIKSADGEILALETGNGTVVIQKSMIKVLKTQDSGFVWKQTIETDMAEKYYKIKTDGKSHEVMMMSLERGITWAPGYAVDISNPDKLTIASKATVMNDLVDLKGIPVRLITGFPNMQFKDILDPFTANMPGEQWLNTLSTGGAGGGGFGGNRGRAGEMMGQNAYAPMMDKDVNWGGNAGGEVGGEQISDLFFYDLPKFDSKKNSRLYQNLFRFDAEYKHIYTWDIEDQVDVNGNYKPAPPIGQDAQEVWHTIKFKNGAKKPLTTAAATIFNKGEMIGQTMMNYCMADGDCDVRINKALDVRVDANEEEVARDRGAIKDRYNNPKYDLVTVKGTLLVLNGRRDKVQMTISKNLTGDVASSTGDPSVTKTTRGLRQVNTTSRLTWKPEVKPGDKLTLEYTYKLYVPAT